MNQFETLIQTCDAEIRAGHPQNVAKLLTRLNVGHIPHEMRLPLARIARRAGLLGLGLRILSRSILRAPAQDPPSPAEEAEYAILLLRSGALGEALERLYRIDGEKVPDARLFRAYAHFARWEYAEAVPELEDFLALKIAPDRELIGRTNLAFAHVECRNHETALTLLEQNIAMAKEQNYRHLETYNLALRAQVHIQEASYAEAAEDLRLARKGSPRTLTHDQFLISKLELIREGLAERELQSFARLRELATTKRDWTTLRDADFFALKVSFDQARFLHLYFGSPLPRFRELLAKEFNIVPARKIYVLGAKSAPRFDLTDGTLDGKKATQAGGKCHQVMEVLLRDFYEPLRVAGLHAALFPNEHFNIASSPQRVHQLVRRTRNWLAARQYPVELREDAGFYSLHLNGDFSFRVPLTRQSVGFSQLQLERLRRQFQSGVTFSTQELCKVLEISTSSAHRLLREGIDSGVIKREGPRKRPKGYRLAG